ncbi:hypothetical protein [Kitasatospora sp. NPDC058218]|uniref:hypothetical protein n=1 Tax=Kitasatospora sp. NPDC058218 TaxID=3346385 RepID=UPI0036DE2D93
MINKIVRDSAGLGPPVPRLPRLVAPVDRSATAVGALASTQGVDADSIWDDILHAIPIPQIPPIPVPGLPPITIPLPWPFGG